MQLNVMHHSFFWTTLTFQMRKIWCVYKFLSSVFKYHMLRGLFYATLGQDNKCTFYLELFNSSFAFNQDDVKH